MFEVSSFWRHISAASRTLSRNPNFRYIRQTYRDGMHRTHVPSSGASFSMSRSLCRAHVGRRLPVQYPGPSFQQLRNFAIRPANPLLVCVKPLVSPRSTCKQCRTLRVQANGQFITTGEPEEPSFTQKAGRVVSKIAQWVAACTALAAVVIGLTPAALNTRPGLRSAVAVVNIFSPGHIHVEEASFHWRGQNSLTGITLSEPARLGGQKVMEVHQISTQQSLLDILRGRPFEVIISSPWVDYSPVDGTPRLQRLLEAGKGRGLPNIAQEAEEDSTPLSDMNFSAEARFLSGHVFVSDGLATVPQEAAQLVGRDLHLVAIVGSENLVADGSEFGLEASWVETEEGAGPTGATPEAQARRKAALDPTMISIRSENIAAEVSGWRMKGGELALRQPVTASVVVTPALARAGLARTNPLLTDIMAVEEGATVHVMVTPDDMKLPADNSNVRIDPLKVSVRAGALVDRTMQLLGFAEAVEGEHAVLAAQTGPIELVVGRRGALTTRRLDVLLGPESSQGVHLAVWGSVDAVKHVDMTLAIPADTLRRVGLTRLPASTVLPIQVKGTIKRPVVDWLRASTGLADLTLEHAAQSPSASVRSLMSKALFWRNKGPATAPGQTVEVPNPVGPLPWEQ